MSTAAVPAVYELELSSLGNGCRVVSLRLELQLKCHVVRQRVDEIKT